MRTPISQDPTMLQITCRMKECNNCLGYKEIGKAVRMIALLRRCLYPKRDVIRWICERGYRIQGTVLGRTLLSEK
eukprot:scaffold75592_cov75-Cyclotella_meneghiniana.AAC.2